MSTSTRKQVELLIKLWKRSGQFREKATETAKSNGRAASPDFHREFEHFLREQLLPEQSAEKLSELIQTANDKLGWDQHQADASPKQVTYIRDLELKVYGERRTQPGDHLSYSDADALIRQLKSLSSASTAGVESMKLPLTYEELLS